MSRTFHNKKLKTWLKNRTGYSQSCRHGGDCPVCVGNKPFIRNEDKYWTKYSFILKYLNQEISE